MEYCFGIDVGGMSVKGGVVTNDGKIIYKCTSKVTVDALSAVQTVVEMLIKYCTEQNISVKNCGIGVPCVFDKKSGRVSYGNNLDFKDVNLKQHFKDKYDIDLVIANDAAAAALGELKFGGGKGCDNLVLITIGTGLGCGIVMNKKLVPSNCSAVGELGHTVVNVGGRKCGCGNYGCLEAYCSMTALYKDIKHQMQRDKKCSLWKALNPNALDGRKFFELLGKDSLADKIFNRFIKYLSLGVLNVANLLRPDLILIGGGVSAQGQVITAPVQKYLDEHLFAKEYTDRIQVRSAINGNDAGILGAAALNYE